MGEKQWILIPWFSFRFGSSAKQNDGDDDSSESSGEEGQAFYAGGSETSGQQILGPKKKEGADFVKHMFKKAREHGAEAVDPNSSAGQAAGGGPSRQTFTGSGFKLGSTGTFFKNQVPSYGKENWLHEMTNSIDF